MALGVDHELVEQGNFAILQQVQTEQHVGWALNIDHLGGRATRLRQLVTLLVDVRKVVLANFDHEDTVVALSRQSGMRDSQEVTELVYRKVALAAASLTADRGNSLEVPAVQSLIDTAKSQQGVLKSFRVLEDIFALHMQQTEADASSEQRHQGVLLQLVVEDRSIRLSSGTDSQTLLSVLDGDVEACAGATNSHGGNAKST